MRIKSFSRAVYTAGVAWVGLLTMASSVKAYTLTSGDVFASIGNGEVEVYSSSGVALQTLNTGLGGFTTGSAFDSSGNFYVTDFSAQAVSKFDSTGTLVGTFGSGYNADPESIVRDASGNFYVGQADGTHNILQLNSTGATTATFAPATQDRGTDWVDLAADQHTIYYTSEGTSIKRFDTATNTQLSDFATGLTGSNAYALRILSDGGVLVADTERVLRLNSAGAIVQTYLASSLGDTGFGLFALNIDPNGTSFWTGDLNNGEIFHVDMATGTVLGTINTSTIAGYSTLAGLSVFGEITQGGGGGGSVPDGGNTLLLLGGSIAALAIWKRGRVWMSASCS